MTVWICAWTSVSDLTAQEQQLLQSIQEKKKQLLFEIQVGFWLLIAVDWSSVQIGCWSDMETVRNKDTGFFGKGFLGLKGDRI